MNQLKYWGNIINIKKNERLQNVHEARAAIEDGLFSLLDCFGDLQAFIKERINSAKAKKFPDQKNSVSCSLLLDLSNKLSNLITSLTSPTLDRDGRKIRDE